MVHLVFALLACDPAPDALQQHADHADHAPAADHADHADHAAEADHADHAGGDGLQLQLDGSARWQMDPHTRSVMGEIRTTLASATPATAAEAQVLQATLQGQLDALIAGCTMTGPSHDQLHAFLSAFMPAVQALGSVADGESAKAAHAHLHALVLQYDAHFE